MKKPPTLWTSLLEEEFDDDRGWGPTRDRGWEDRFEGIWFKCGVKRHMVFEFQKLMKESIIQ